MEGKDELYKLEDQAEWERCNSYQRMFLALHDAGHRKSMDRVATALVELMQTYRPESLYADRAYDALYNGGADEAHARSSYMVFTLVARAIDEPVLPLPPPGGGSSVVCMAIRREHPLAPGGFRKVGKLEGKPNEQGPSAQSSPFRLFFKLSPDKDVTL